MSPYSLDDNTISRASFADSPVFVYAKELMVIAGSGEAVVDFSKDAIDGFLKNEDGSDLNYWNQLKMGTRVYTLADYAYVGSDVVTAAFNAKELTPGLADNTDANIYQNWNKSESTSDSTSQSASASQSQSESESESN